MSEYVGFPTCKHCGLPVRKSGIGTDVWYEHDMSEAVPPLGCSAEVADGTDMDSHDSDKLCMSQFRVSGKGWYHCTQKFGHNGICGTADAPWTNTEPNGDRMDLSELPTPEEIAMTVMQSEEMMWLMIGANHTESHLNILRGAWEAYIAAGGLTYGKTQ